MTGTRRPSLNKIARAIISRSACATSKDKLLIVFDATAIDIAEALMKEAADMGISLIGSFVPFTVQLKQSELSDHVRFYKLITASTILITALTDTPDSTPFRGSLVSIAVRKKLKTIHMPGFSTALLQSSGVHKLNFQQLAQIAQEVASQLSQTSNVSIYTTTTNNEEHQLNLSINDRIGHADGGLASKSEVINIPSGEAFIAPIENSAEGSIVINGSIPDWVLGKNDEFILVFKHGKLILKDCFFPNTPSVKFFTKEIIQKHSKSAQNCLQIGEFGIGVNQQVKELVGDALIDEKMAGTAHIALGRNDFMGGTNCCEYHHDLIFYPKSITFDNQSVVIPWKLGKRGSLR